jgi:hypothetical protein
MPSEVTFRPVFARLLAVVLVLGVVALLVDVYLVGGASAAARDVGPLGLFAWTIWLLLWRPALFVDQQGATIRNPLRTVTIPWAAVRSIDTRYALTVITYARRWTCWVAPASGRSAVRNLSESELKAMTPDVVDDDGTVRVGDMPDTDSGKAQLLLRSYWRRDQEAGDLGVGAGGAGGAEPVEQVRWHRGSILLGAVLLVATVAAAF